MTIGGGGREVKFSGEGKKVERGERKKTKEREKREKWRKIILQVKILNL